MSEFKTSVRQGSLVAAIAVLVFASTSSALIRNVPGDFPTIQEAIAASKDGDEVVVAPGVYNEAIDFLGLAIIVRSSDGPDVTTIDATGLDTSVVSCINLEGPDTVLDGFTITGGFAAKGAGMFNPAWSWSRRLGRPGRTEGSPPTLNSRQLLTSGSQVRTARRINPVVNGSRERASPAVFA